MYGRHAHSGGVEPGGVEVEHLREETMEGLEDGRRQEEKKEG